MKQIKFLFLSSVVALFLANCAILDNSGSTGYCGDLVCDSGESASSCPSDCGSASGGTWYTPVSTSSITLGACQWIDAYYASSDYCMTNYYEGSCTMLGGYGGTMLFSTSTGSTSMTTSSNLCVDNGYTGCYDAGGFLMCGPNYVSGADLRPLLDLVRSAYDQNVPQRTR